MKKKPFAMLLVITLLLSAFLCPGLAYRKVDPEVPVWEEETVKDYMYNYVRGKDMDELWNYYDLQIRRYLPPSVFETMLTEIEWMTGAFVGFGTYHCFEEPSKKTKTHVLHLCMELQDQDVYFTHKNEPANWQVMAVEFVPAEKQAVLSHGE